MNVIETSTAPRATKTKSFSRLSKDGKWRSFIKVPNLLQYVSSGVYFARVKVNGKIFRKSLENDVWSTAKLRLVDFLKEHATERTADVAVPSFSEAAQRYRADIQNDTAMKESSKHYLLSQCLGKIERSWPELQQKKLTEIRADECKEWAVKLKEEISSTFFNNTIATLRHVIETGIKEYVRRGGADFENPAVELSRARSTQKELQLPEKDQFRKLVESIRQDSGGWGRRAADLVEFLAYSGVRLTEGLWITWEDVDWQRKEIVVRGDPETATKNWDIRRIPIIPDMESLLQRLSAEREGTPTGRIVECERCYESLLRACKAIGIPRISHHDLRHLFATRCIESGVDIPTVARWLGHKDGGGLAMKTYGHLRNEHSQAMAQKVKF